jgi:hypothetical protein
VNSKSVPDRLPFYSFRPLARKTAPAAIRAVAVLSLVSSLVAAPQQQAGLPSTIGHEAAPAPADSDRQVQLMAQAGQFFSVSSIAFSPDGRFVLTASDEHPAILWSVDGGKEIRKFEGLESVITCVAFLPDGRSRDSAVSLTKTFRGCKSPW